MNRHLSDDNFKRFIVDFKFLFKILRNSYGDLDLRLRDNYFNVYNRGNSMLKVEFLKTNYKISIHKKFDVNITSNNDKRYKLIATNNNPNSNYIVYRVPSNLLHFFIQKNHLELLRKKIKKIDYGEEISYEQTIIADNFNREDLFIIDRQIADYGWGSRADLLALRQDKGNSYYFELIEVKMGNNEDLKGNVAQQIQRYLKHINNDIKHWQVSYEKTYQQLKKTNIFDKPSFNAINILPRVEGKIVVIGYTGIAKTKINILKQKHQNIKIQLMENILK